MTLPSLPNQDFFENYAQAILITKKDNTPVFINPAFTKLTGFDSGKLHLINPVNLFQEKAYYSPENLEKNSSRKTDLIKNDGAVVNVTVSISAIVLSDLSEGRLYTITDSSPFDRIKGLLRESEKQLAAAKNKISSQEKVLLRLNEELEQFAYVASHDMQEPLRMIASYVQLIQKNIEQGNTQNINEFMKFVVEGAERMQLLISDMLQISRINRQGDSFSNFNLNELVPVAMAQLATKIKGNDAKITLDKLPSVYGDSSQILRLFQNLLDNAIKFKAPDRKPEIAISVEERESDYLFSVKDNGIGIADKFYHRIFIIFQRLHSRTEYEGNGIGLAVCKKIVERHGGDIWIESEVGVGSTIYFTLKK